MRWEYATIDLSQIHAGRSETDALNAAGEHGWELVQILAPNRAILKRCIQDNEHVETAPATATRASAAAKYRDPVTGETWSGRGRMATWLANKVRAGEPLESFLVD